MWHSLGMPKERARITQFLGMASSRASQQQQQLTARYHFELVFDKLEYYVVRCFPRDADDNDDTPDDDDDEPLP